MVSGVTLFPCFPRPNSRACHMMNGDSELYSETRAALTIAARESTRQLAADLERLESGLKMAA